MEDSITGFVRISALDCIAFAFVHCFQVNFPLCTLAHTPRLPEHCIEYVRLLLWSKDNPFGGDEVAIDGDDPAHITWIFEKSLERATHYGIQGVTYRLIINDF
jgi:ubiquitin-activating enzyme E1 C